MYYCMMYKTETVIKSHNSGNRVGVIPIVASPLNVKKVAMEFLICYKAHAKLDICNF